MPVWCRWKEVMRISETDGYFHGGYTRRVFDHLLKIDLYSQQKIQSKKEQQQQ